MRAYMRCANTFFLDTSFSFFDYLCFFFLLSPPVYHGWSLVFFLIFATRVPWDFILERDWWFLVLWRLRVGGSFR